METLKNEFDRVFRTNYTLQDISGMIDLQTEIKRQRNVQFGATKKHFCKSFVGHKLGSFNFDIDIDVFSEEEWFIK